MELLNCSSIKESLIEYLRREVEVAAFTDYCVLTLPLKTVDDRLVDVTVERKTPDYFLIHDNGKSISELFVQGITLTESVRQRLESIARLNGAQLVKDVFTVGCKFDRLQDGIITIGLCCTMAMLELIGHKPEFEEEPISARVGRSLKQWQPQFIRSIDRRVQIKGRRFQHSFDFVAFAKDEPQHRTSAIKLLTPSYGGTIQAERYAFLVLDIENTIFDQWSRCAILSKIEMWPANARKMIKDLSTLTIELKTGEESEIEQILPQHMEQWKRTSNVSVADILREARRRIEEPEKWGKGSNLRIGIECAYMAIDQAAELKLAYNETFRFFRLAIAPASISPDSVSIIAWNDAPERTHADVLAAFDRAIAMAEEAEEKT